MGVKKIADSEHEVVFQLQAVLDWTYPLQLGTQGRCSKISPSGGKSQYLAFKFSSSMHR